MCSLCDYYATPAQSNRDKQPWAETSESMNQNKPFLLISSFSGVFHYSTGKLTNTGVSQCIGNPHCSAPAQLELLELHVGEKHVCNYLSLKHNYFAFKSKVFMYSFNTH